MTDPQDEGVTPFDKFLIKGRWEETVFATCVEFDQPGTLVRYTDEGVLEVLDEGAMRPVLAGRDAKAMFDAISQIISWSNHR